MNDQYHGIVPYLFFDDVERAMDWYGRVFGFDPQGQLEAVLIENLD